MDKISRIWSWLKIFTNKNWANKKIPIILTGIILFVQHNLIIHYYLLHIVSIGNFEKVRLLSWCIHSIILYPIAIFLITRKGS